MKEAQRTFCPKAVTEFSFILKPSSLGGIGVFATHDIEEGSKLFDLKFNARLIDLAQLPEPFHIYCIFISEKRVICPKDFNRMEIGWYINHSFSPNVYRKPLNMHNLKEEEIIEDLNNHHGIASKNIFAGEEMLVDYNLFNEPANIKEPYYIK